ncbi:MAG TPA: hypothetical protein VFR10_06345, partial [bacterium]|nr:hypothetical protein [bacterium]
MLRRIAIAAMLWAGGAQAAPVAIIGGTVHPISGPAIDKGVLVFDGGQILAVGREGAVSVPSNAERVDADGLHVWPGMIDGYSTIGLREISSVRGTVDMTESGQINPNARAEVAVNASSMHIPVTRANGVLLAATVPSGSMVPGSSAVIALDGWTFEDMVRKAPAGLVIRWPNMDLKARGEEEGDGETWEQQVARLDDMVAEARSYAGARTSKSISRDKDVRWESLQSVIDQKTRVWIAASTL